MKIAMITRTIPPQTDGVGDYTMNLAKALAQMGEEIDLITERGQNASASESAVSVRPAISDWGPRGVLHLLELIRKLRVDHINLQYVPHMYGRWGINFFAAFIPVLLRLIAKKPVITTCHELLSHKPLTLKSRVLQGFYLIQAWLILAGSTSVIVPATWQEKQLRRLFPRFSTKIHRIPAGNNIPVSNGLNRPEQSPVTGKTFFTIGTFGPGPWWQHEMAIRILKGLRDQKINARLLCLGDIEGKYPRYFSKLRRLASELNLTGMIDWTGYVSPERASRLLQQVDVFLALHTAGITSRNTGFIAAMAHGLPIVTTSGPDADDWILESNAVAVVDPNDLARMTQEVTSLLSDHRRRVGLGKKALDFYTRCLTWDIIRESFMHVTCHNRADGTG